MLLSDFKAHGPICIPTFPITALTEFFHADAMANGPSIASIVIFNILAMSVPVFLYAYYAYGYDISPMISASVIIRFYLKF